MSKIIAYCETHPSERLELFVEHKPLEHKSVVQVKPCPRCIEVDDPWTPVSEGLPENGDYWVRIKTRNGVIYHTEMRYDAGDGWAPLDNRDCVTHYQPITPPK